MRAARAERSSSVPVLIQLRLIATTKASGPGDGVRAVRDGPGPLCRGNTASGNQDVYSWSLSQFAIYVLKNRVALSFKHF